MGDATARPYRGRFAPSPTGPLHLGSLLTATASFLDARAARGEWWLRIEDLDATRVVPSAADDIRATLEAHGLLWDGEVEQIRDRLDRYFQALDHLARAGLTFRCTCSRSQLAGTRIYPGTCRTRAVRDPQAAVRVRVGDAEIEFVDRIQGPVRQHLGRDVGDFVVLRRDGIPAYQLAVVVDDADQHVTDVVRGADLLDNTPRQIFLCGVLGLDAPRYAHVPLVVDANGAKLSKQTFAARVDSTSAPANLLRVLDMLGQSPDPALLQGTVADVLHWAIAHWRLEAVPRTLRLEPLHPGGRSAH
jgi:glutamyl-Q tRNA(Asp) synthetase